MLNPVDILTTRDEHCIATWYDEEGKRFHLDATNGVQAVNISLTHAELRALWQMFLGAFLKEKGI
jgi:hypothetical protein